MLGSCYFADLAKERYDTRIAGRFSKNLDATKIPHLKTNDKVMFIPCLLSNKQLDYVSRNSSFMLNILVGWHCVPALMSVALQSYIKNIH
jgi:hypothetical protein